MFTGLIEEVGIIQTVHTTPEGAKMTVSASTVMEDLSIGDSIAIDGACMTVTALSSLEFSFDVSPESLNKTHFSSYQAGKRVNLERPLKPSSRIGGHYVTGHVNGLTRLACRYSDGNCERFVFDITEENWLQLIVPKGSVALLGISLTVNTVSSRQFSVAIIPHTLTHTTLGEYQAGDLIPLETDLLGKYVQHMVQAPGSQSPYSLNDTASKGKQSTVSIDNPALAPAMEALRKEGSSQSAPSFTQTPSSDSKKATIHSGNWFNAE